MEIRMAADNTRVLRGFLSGLKACRLRSKIGTQEDAAKRLHVPHGTYRNWEQCISVPQEKEKLFEVCALFDCTLDELFGRVPVLAYEGKLSNVSDSNLSHAVSTYLTSANDAGKSALSLLVEILASNRETISSSESVSLITLINSALAQKQGDGGDPAIRAAAI